MSRLNAARLLAWLVIGVLGQATVVRAEPNWPQFRGPNRDGVSPETGLLQAWPEDGPKLIWKTEGAGRGYSSFSIGEGKLFTMGDSPSTANDEDEYLIAFNFADGKPLWKTKLGRPWSNGPNNWQSSRSTPTYDNGKLYALTAHGDLVCANAGDGAIVWRKNLKEDFDGKKGDDWGYGESVLIDGELLLCTPGGEENTLVALKKESGELVWSCVREGDRGAGHASMQISRVGGVKVYVQTTAQGALGVRASDGKLMWSYEIDRTTAVIPSPIVRDDLVFFTAGYGRGGALLRQVPDGDGVTMEEVYGLKTSLQNKHGGVVLVGDNLYGDAGDRGVPFSADLMTGEQNWKERGSGSGSAAFAAADGQLYILFQDSTMVLANANPDEYKETGSFKLPGGEDPRPSWAHPVITDGKLIVRQDDFVFCYDISAGSK